MFPTVALVSASAHELATHQPTQSLNALAKITQLLTRILQFMRIISQFQSPAFRKIAAGVIVITLLVVGVVFFFPWDILREPVNRYVSEQLGRRFEITQRLSVSLGRTNTVRLDGVEFANPDWASEPYLIKAKAVEFDIKFWPLITGRVVLPRLALFEPVIALQMQADGRKSWALARDTTSSRSTPDIGAMTVDKGTLKYRAAQYGADVTARFVLESDGAKRLPLRYEASGKWRDAVFSANGQTGSVLVLSRDVRQTFPIEVKAQSGKTQLSAKGTVDNLQEFAGLSASFDIQGPNLDELYKFTGVVLPSTPPYRLSGQLSKQDMVWIASQLRGVLGQSDISGDMRFDTSAALPMLTGKVQSKVLDFADLLPVIGLPVKNAAPLKKPGPQRPVSGQPVANRLPPAAALSGKVLPTATLDLARLKSMNADVIYSAADIRHADQLPLDKGSVHVKLNQGIMQLEPLVLGVAGGSFSGRIKVDVNRQPAAFETQFDLRGVALNKLFPTIESTKSSLGKISGQVALKGQGNSMAQMLGSASGDVAMLMGKGEISNILMEFLGLDGGEIIKFFLRGDRNVSLRCAAAAFGVKQGLMSSKVIVLDTSDTVINGSGQVSLTNETLDMVLKPEPKDKSILSLRSPLRIGGTFAAPTAGPDTAALGVRAGLAIALGAVNPFLALLATIETGPGQDADCTGALATASRGKSAAGAKAKVQ